jgi:protein KTI12
LSTASAQKTCLATIPAKLEDSNYLFELDKLTQDICTEIVSIQNSCMIGDNVLISGHPFTVSRRIHLPELRRLQSQFFKIAKLRPPENQQQISQAFVQHVNGALKM